MSLLKSAVGTPKARSPRYVEEVSADRVRKFCQAVGAQDLTTAPPTFLTVFRRGEFDLLDRLGLKLSNALHAEQEYDLVGSVQTGGSVEFETVLASVMEKQTSSTRLQFLVLETEFHSLTNSEKALIGKARTTIVFREKIA